MLEHAFGHLIKLQQIPENECAVLNGGKICPYFLYRFSSIWMLGWIFKHRQRFKPNLQIRVISATMKNGFNQDTFKMKNTLLQP